MKTVFSVSRSGNKQNIFMNLPGDFMAMKTVNKNFVGAAEYQHENIGSHPTETVFGNKRFVDE